MFGSEDYHNMPKEIHELCENTFNNLEKNYYYRRRNAWESLIFLNNLKILVFNLISLRNQLKI